MMKLLTIASVAFSILIASSGALASGTTVNINSFTSGNKTTLVGDLDKVWASTTLKNSGDETELNWIKSLLTDDYAEMVEKVSMSESNWFLMDDYSENEQNTTRYAARLKNAPDFFLLKMGNMSPGKGNKGNNESKKQEDKSTNTEVPTHFLFENADMLEWAAIDFSVLSDELAQQGFNIGKISHVSMFSVSAVPNPVSEPSSILLFSLVLGGLVVSKRRRS